MEPEKPKEATDTSPVNVPESSAGLELDVVPAVSMTEPEKPKKKFKIKPGVAVAVVTAAIVVVAMGWLILSGGGGGIKSGDNGILEGIAKFFGQLNPITAVNESKRSGEERLIRDADGNTTLTEAEQDIERRSDLALFGNKLIEYAYENGGLPAVGVGEEIFVNGSMMYVEGYGDANDWERFYKNNMRTDGFTEVSTGIPYSLHVTRCDTAEGCPMKTDYFAEDEGSAGGKDVINVNPGAFCEGDTAVGGVGEKSFALRILQSDGSVNCINY